MFPDSADVPRVPCRRCKHPTRVDRLREGYGPECAALLGLTVSTPRLKAHEQDGPDLLDLLPDPDPEDECDGWDHPAG